VERGKAKQKSWVEKAKVRYDHIQRGLCRDCTEPAKPGINPRTNQPYKSCERHINFAVQRRRKWRIYHGFQNPVSLSTKVSVMAQMQDWTTYVPSQSSNSEVPF
jgi:hypothetical protein